VTSLAVNFWQSSN